MFSNRTVDESKRPRSEPRFVAVFLAGGSEIDIESPASPVQDEQGGSAPGHGVYHGLRVRANANAEGNPPMGDGDYRPEPIGWGTRWERTKRNSLSTPILYLKLPNPFYLYGLVLHFLLFSILVQIPILFLFLFFFEPLGVERELWGKRQLALRSNAVAETETGVKGWRAESLNVRDLAHSFPYSFLLRG